MQVDLMSQVGTHTFDMVPGQDIYEAPITSKEPGGAEVKLKFQIRDTDKMVSPTTGCTPSQSSAQGRDIMLSQPHSRPCDSEDPQSPSSPSRKLLTAQSMSNYLETHDVLMQMQALLQDMAADRPEDPIEYMIQRFEDVCESVVYHPLS